MRIKDSGANLSHHKGIGICINNVVNGLFGCDVGFVLVIVEHVVNEVMLFVCVIVTKGALPVLSRLC